MGLLPISKAGKENQDYLKRLSDRPEHIKVIKCGLVDWKDDPQSWAGAFAKKYAFCRITDHSLEVNLPTMAQVAAQWAAYHKYSMYQYPFAIREKHKKEMQIKYQGTLCSRSSLTEAERIAWDKEVEELSPILKWKMEADREKAFLNSLSEPSLSKETPIKFYLCGNDDSSYTQVYSDEEQALAALRVLLDTPTWAILKLLGFNFTN